jgi:hypothetical protein
LVLRGFWKAQDSLGRFFFFPSLTMETSACREKERETDTCVSPGTTTTHGLPCSWRFAPQPTALRLHKGLPLEVSQVSKSSRKEQRNGKTKRKSIKLESLISHDRNNNSKAMNKSSKREENPKISLSERLSRKSVIMRKSNSCEQRSKSKEAKKAT